MDWFQVNLQPQRQLQKKYHAVLESVFYANMQNLSTVRESIETINWNIIQASLTLQTRFFNSAQHIQ